MMLGSFDAAHYGRLAQTLTALPAVREFRISPTGD